MRWLDGFGIPRLQSLFLPLLYIITYTLLTVWPYRLLMSNRDGTDPSELPHRWSMLDLEFVNFAAGGILSGLGVPHEAAHMNVTFEFELRCLEFRRPIM